ncbi:phosphoribosylformimino-5-aminoimidazole carboxamide ribotide isomerase [Methanosarcina sp. 1.H.T.1A.1]|uniref:HisA/HisF-related TIM barrel protein n=1 Tax=Methanosarcina sp. 1.H.T.1A.1 TaxID=1483602 RepID=UPI0006225A12|nr:HisA/HisF-related TIM barrel protein [Methanosarcina sp. 1.H.T.1A.1]KKH96445.1 phosphoribosylformimino-5-aminoimidazole carboxamide ribotide isomerase [Methanosarcina sp. 1.H.T.1A.1]
MFRVIFVMDIFNRNVVLAKGGVRENYRPVSDSSVICSSSDPVDILESVHPREVYIADLNVLQGKGPLETNASIIREVSFRAETMLDFGIASLEDVDKALSIAQTAVIGTETGTLAVIKEAALRYPGKISVSIDIKHGKLLKQDPEIPQDPFEIVKLLNGLPLKDLLFLDLDRVGTASGFDSEFLRKLAEASEHSVLLAGGVKGMDDLFALERIGVRGALVATAIHSGSVPPEVMDLGLEIIKKGN